MAKEPERQFDTQEVQWEDEEMRQRVEARRRAISVRKRRKRVLTLFVIIITFTLLATMCGKDIVRLKAENRALRKQVALEKQRDELQEELKNTNNQEYIREQAKKQLRLLNPGEILFTFDEEEAVEEAEENGQTEKSGKDRKDRKSDKSDKSDKDKDGDSDE